MLLGAAEVYQDKLGEMVSFIKTTDLLRGMDEVDLREAGELAAHPLVEKPPENVRGACREHFERADACFDKVNAAWLAQLLNTGTSTGEVWAARDEGTAWRCGARGLPHVYSVEIG